MNIPITKPCFDNEEREIILKPLESGWLVQGRYVAEFESSFAAFSGVRFAKATTSCTTALHLALEVLGIKEGDAVIVPSFTFVASANSIEYTGARPVFADIDPRTFNIDIDSTSKILEKDRGNGNKIKAIMPVHLFGLCADMDGIKRLSEEYGLKVIEDAACGLGAYIGKKHSGTFGDAGCFSFHPRKAVTTGEGGMLVTNNEALADIATSLRDHGASKSDYKRHVEKGGSLLPEFNIRGYNYRLTDIQGALGVAQMKKAADVIEKRGLVARKYDEALKDNISLLKPFVPDGYRHGYQSYVCLFTGGVDISTLDIEAIDRLNVRRNHIMAELEEKGIATRQGTHAVHTLGYYREKYGIRNGDFLKSYMADRLSITLPLYASMTEAEFGYVMEHLAVALKGI